MFRIRSEQDRHPCRAWVKVAFVFFLVLFFSSLDARGASKSPEIEINWLGQSCFLVHIATVFPSVSRVPLRRSEKFARPGPKLSKRNFSILLDPYNSGVGYPVHPVKADVVFISHEHFDHNNAGMAPGARIIRGLKDNASAWSNFDETLSPRISLRTVGTYHDNVRGRERGLNSVAVIDINGLRIVHLGDLGHLLSSQQVKAIGHVDVLLIPVGGVYTIDGTQAKKVAEELKPRVVIPMHYKTTYTILPIHSDQEFLEGNIWPVKRLRTSSLILSMDRLPKKTVVVELQPLLK